jgi:hypothetical protein
MRIPGEMVGHIWGSTGRFASAGRTCTANNGELETGAKTRLSKSTVPMHHVLGPLLKEWRAESAYASDDDFVFASRKLMGRKPPRGSMVVADGMTT